nr:uncharacterized serine-rich protein C215.13-like [Lolium perenne]
MPDGDAPRQVVRRGYGVLASKASMLVGRGAHQEHDELDGEANGARTATKSSENLAAVVGEIGQIRQSRGSSSCKLRREERGEDGGAGSILGEAQGCLNHRRSSSFRHSSAVYSTPPSSWPPSTLHEPWNGTLPSSSTSSSTSRSQTRQELLEIFHVRIVYVPATSSSSSPATFSAASSSPTTPGFPASLPVATVRRLPPSWFLLNHGTTFLLNLVAHARATSQQPALPLSPSSLFLFHRRRHSLQLLLSPASFQVDHAASVADVQRFPNLSVWSSSFRHSSAVYSTPPSSWPPSTLHEPWNGTLPSSSTSSSTSRSQTRQELLEIFHVCIVYVPATSSSSSPATFSAASSSPTTPGICFFPDRIAKWCVRYAKSFGCSSASFNRQAFPLYSCPCRSRSPILFCLLPHAILELRSCHVSLPLVTSSSPYCHHQPPTSYSCCLVIGSALRVIVHASAVYIVLPLSLSYRVICWGS